MSEKHLHPHKKDSISKAGRSLTFRYSSMSSILGKVLMDSKVPVLKFVITKRACFKYLSIDFWEL